MPWVYVDDQTKTGLADPPLVALFCQFCDKPFKTPAIRPLCPLCHTNGAH
jgi:hypothetical protein